MSLFVPPGWLQNSGATNTAVQMRNYISGLAAGTRVSGSLVSRGGCHHALGNKLVVIQTGSPSMAVIVRSGVAWVPGSENASQGAYGVLNDADVTVSVTAAHATLARIDIVCIKVQDSQYSGAVNTCSIVVVAGTPSGSPVVPTAPDNSLTLAQIAVGAAVSTITTANITDKRIWIDQGSILCTSTTRPAAGTVAFGQIITQWDNNRTYVTYDGGTSWVELSKRKYLAGVAYYTGGDAVTNAGVSGVIGPMTFTAEVGNTYILTVTSRIKGSVAGSQAILQGKHVAGSGPPVAGSATTTNAITYAVPSDTSTSDNFTFISEFVASASGTYSVGLYINFFSGSGTVTISANGNAQYRIAVTEAIPV